VFVFERSSRDSSEKLEDFDEKDFRYNINILSDVVRDP
jgi:hypothetical protein